MRFLATILFLSPLFLFSQTTYYISTTGNDANPGTLAQPFRNLQKISSLTLNPGDIVYIRAGTYNSATGGTTPTTFACLNINAKNGASGNPILISAYPPDFPSGGRVIFNCLDVNHTVNSFGINVQNCSYIKFYGIKVNGVAQQIGSGSGTITGAWWSNTSSFITFENCEADSSMTGFRLDDGTDVTFKNCDAHDQDDPFTGGTTGPHNNSDGFARTASGNVATNTVYSGCRSWHNSDDGWDCFGTNGKITYDSCWSWANGYRDSSGVIVRGGDGNGFKMGGSGTNVTSPITRFANNCLAVMNALNGFDQNNGIFVAQFYNNVSYKNLVSDWKFGYNPPLAHIFKNNISYQNAIIDGNSSDAIYWVQATNSWNNIPPSTTSFTSLDTTGISGSRAANGTLPTLTFLHLSTNSNFVNSGTYVGLPFCGVSPDLGAFEYCPALQPLTLTASNTIISCFGGTSTVTLGVTGGQAPFTYNKNGGSYGSSNIFSSLTAGTYIFGVKDALGATTTVTVNILQPTQITISQVSGTISINGGTTTTTVTASGGTGASSNYRYKLDAGSYQTSNVFTGVAAGTHTITVKDSLSCTNTLNYSIPAPSVPTLYVTISVSGSIACYGDSVDVTVGGTGGTSPYTGTGVFRKPAGTYTFSISDAGSQNADTIITITQPDKVQVLSIIPGTITTAGGTTSVIVNAGGGVGDFQYSIDGGGYQSSDTLTGVSGGNHTITVKDANSCTGTFIFNLYQPPTDTYFKKIRKSKHRYING